MQTVPTPILTPRRLPKRHPEAGALWEKHINKILDDLDIVYCQIRGDELDDAGTYELVHHIRGKAIADELALGSFTRRKLKQLPIWDLWLASEWKQLDAHQKQEVFGTPCPAPPDATVLRSHWNYIIKPCGTRKARMCCDGSKRAAPVL